MFYFYYIGTYFIISMKPHGESGSEEREGFHFRLMIQSLLPFKILKIILYAVLQLNLVKLSPKAIC